MKNKRKAEAVDLTADYREESLKGPLLTAVAAVFLVGVPLGFWIQRINVAGLRAADVSKYDALVQSVEGRIKVVNTMLQNNTQDIAVINSAKKTAVVTLIVPEPLAVEEEQQAEIAMSAPLRVSIDGIYWSSASPLVGINGETYREGDRVKGHTIIEIRKTNVRFRDDLGNEIVMDMYENLLKESR